MKIEMEDFQSPSLEELGLVLTEPCEEVVRSMERLYAVPSEKLRVWMVWLGSVGEIADEWHKWLQEHIDLIARIVRSRQTAGNVLPVGRKIESVANVKSDEFSDNAAPSKKIKLDVSHNSSNVADVSVQRQDGKSLKNNNGTDEVGRTAVNEKETAGVWPIGTRWQPLTPPIGKRDGMDQMVEIRDIKMPKDEMDMIELLRTFTHQITLYRSYYKHWKETADQAVKEIAGRTVMSTAKIRGMVNDESAMVAEPAQYSMKQTASAQRIAETTVQPIASASKVTSALNAIKSPIKSTGQDTNQTTDQSEVVETSVAVSEISEAESTGTRLTPMTQSKTTIESPLSILQTTSSQNEITAKRATAEKLVRDMARVEENIPYFFYLKSEPDIDIAIQHNDEKVIPTDFGRESISVNYRYLYFNLIDKPGKNGAICL